MEMPGTTDTITVSSESINTTAIAIMPRSEETPVQAVTRQMATYRAINTLIDLTFIKGVDFDTIPGTDKPTLQLPGIEKARGLLGLREEFHDIAAVRDYSASNPFFYYEVECVLYSIVGGQEVARGQGVCHTREKAFMRTGVRVCPECEKPTIMKSKFVPRGSKPGTKPGWYCNEKAGGCNASFEAEDTRITAQETGSSNDPQLVWDGVNRARKIANKRALADAIKRVGMLSSRFTVDLEDNLSFSPSELSGESTHVEEKKTEQKQEPPAPKMASCVAVDESCQKRLAALLEELGIVNHKPYFDAFSDERNMFIGKYSEHPGTFDELLEDIRELHEIFNKPQIEAQPETPTPSLDIPKTGFVIVSTATMGEKAAVFDTKVGPMTVSVSRLAEMLNTNAGTTNDRLNNKLWLETVKPEAWTNGMSVTFSELEFHYKVLASLDNPSLYVESAKAVHDLRSNGAAKASDATFPSANGQPATVSTPAAQSHGTPKQAAIPFQSRQFAGVTPDQDAARFASKEAE